MMSMNTVSMHCMLHEPPLEKAGQPHFHLHLHNGNCHQSRDTLQTPSVHLSIFHLPPSPFPRGGFTSHKMSINNEALQKLLQEVETQALAAQQQISLVRTQQASKQRELRMAQLTRTEMSALPPDTNVYEGVGKMFVALPVSEMQSKLGAQIKGVEGDIDGLSKRLHYLEVSQKNSKDHFNRILGGGGS
ncbi:Prefoldin [Xylariomycetidae sp. FL0641]|nr:Prefoldin [Xylariomycetidae sp. FL0641]